MSLVRAYSVIVSPPGLDRKADMNAVDTNKLHDQITSLVRLLMTNAELFEDGVISKGHYNRNKKLINDRITTLVDLQGSVK